MSFKEVIIQHWECNRCHVLGPEFTGTAESERPADWLIGNLEKQISEPREFNRTLRMEFAACPQCAPLFHEDYGWK